MHYALQYHQKFALGFVSLWKRRHISCCCGSCIAQFTENSFMPNSCVIGFVLPFTVNSSITILNCIVVEVYYSIYWELLHTLLLCGRSGTPSGGRASCWRPGSSAYGFCQHYPLDNR